MCGCLFLFPSEDEERIDELINFGLVWLRNGNRFSSQVRFRSLLFSWCSGDSIAGHQNRDEGL